MNDIMIEIRKPVSRGCVVPLPTQDRMHAPEKIGATQSLTPEGYLLCEGVPITRIGTFIYGQHEIPIEGGPDGLVRVLRTEDQVFNDITIASFEGKPITDDHPPMGVSPENFKEHVVGSVHNVRRGSGIDSDLLLADLLIQDKDAIEAVRDGKREISCGYDADYEQMETAGHARQINIVGNHAALVENGRAGARCAIQDRSSTMTKKTSVTDLIHRAFKSKDSKDLDAILKEAEDVGAESSTQVHVHVGDKKAKDEGEEGEEKKDDVKDALASMKDMLEVLMKDKAARDKKSKDDGEGEQEEEGETADEENEEKTDDEEAEEDPKKVKDTAARLEILVPGTKMPTRDSKAEPKKFKDAVVSAKRKALDAALNGEHKEVLQPLLGSFDLKKTNATTVDALFISASEIVKVKNNASGTRKTVDTKNFGKAVTAAEINANNRKFWADKGIKN